MSIKMKYKELEAIDKLRLWRFAVGDKIILNKIEQILEDGGDFDDLFAELKEQYGFEFLNVEVNNDMAR